MTPNKPLNLFIIGPSGCGKSTQAKLIANAYSLTHISMGQLLRDEMALGSDYGVQAQKYINNGQLCPDDLVFDILIAHLKSLHYRNFIVDGFPRVLNQGKIVEYYLRQQKMLISAVIHLMVTFEEIGRRRHQMGDKFQDKARTDNSPQDILNRQKFYDDNIDPIRQYFSSKSEFVNIDGNRPIEPIFADICLAIDNLI